MHHSAKIRDVVFILSDFNAGGAERVIITIANTLDRSQFRPVIIALKAHGHLETLISSDIEIINLNQRNLTLSAYRLIQAVNKLSPSLVVSTHTPINIMMLLIRPFFLKTSLIIREPTIAPAFGTRSLKRIILNLSYALLYDRADCLLAPTHVTANYMPQKLRKKFSCIPNPVDPKICDYRFDSELRLTLAQPNQRLFVASGRLTRAKGFDLLIHALRPWKSDDSWRLVIIGEGPERRLLETMIKEYQLTQITLTGYKKEPWPYYATADIVLLPSRYEGLPNIALESIAVGTPVLALDSAGGIKEIQAESSEEAVIITSSIEAFIKKLKEPLKPKRTGAIGLPNTYDLDKIVKRYEGLFIRTYKNDL